MATTTNYGWTTPDDTSLVKDGASAIRTLGSSIDTTTKNLNPSTTLGDIEYRSSTANTNTRLAIGTTNQTLTVVGGVPTWAPSAASVMTTKGDLLSEDNTGALTRLAVGANDTVLTADSSTATGLKWSAPSGLPTGFVMMYAANSAPTGFLKANGAAVSRSTYSALFTAIGTTFGVGDGSTTFNVPDLRGRFARGWADDGSIDSGRAFGSNQEATSVTDDGGDGATTESRVKNSDGDDGTINVNANSPTTNRDVTYKKVRPVNTALLACIKF